MLTPHTLRTNTKTVLLILLFNILTLTTFSEDRLIQLDKYQYLPFEKVNINLNIDIQDTHRLVIKNQGKEYQLFDPKQYTYFIPSAEGRYVVELYSSTELMASQEFMVGEVPESEQNESDQTHEEEELLENTSIMNLAIYTNKPSYSVNEPVQILTSYEGGFKNLILTVHCKDIAYRFMNEPRSGIMFVPKEPGEYVIKVTDPLGRLVAEVQFNVEGIVETAPEGISNSVSEIGVVEDVVDAEPEDNEDTEEVSYSLVKIKNSNNELFDSKAKIYGQTQTILGSSNVSSSTYTMEIQLDNNNGPKIIFKDIKISDSILLNYEQLDQGIVRQGNLASKNIKKAYAIDPSTLEFSSGELRLIAEGTELFKCKNYDFLSRSCYGSWDKIMDIVPGQEYSIILGPEDPAYAEAGVASINTVKSIYHPNETAGIMIVVLDKYGHLVSNAEVNLTITDPNNSSFYFSTNANTISETQTGIYSLNFTQTEHEGNYLMKIIAYGANTNQTMQSYFNVQEHYEFDILRNTPITIDPWKYRLVSSILIVSNNYTGNFSFAEVLPLGFGIESAAGAILTSDESNIYLTWNNLANNSLIVYSSYIPLITPALYEIGPSIITYGTSSFYEARAWYLAVDPSQAQMFKETFPNADGTWNGDGNGDTAQDMTGWYAWQEGGDMAVQVSDLDNAAGSLPPSGGNHLTFEDCDNGFSNTQCLAAININLSACDSDTVISWYWQHDDTDGFPANEGHQVHYSTDSTTGQDGTWTLMEEQIDPTENTWFRTSYSVPSSANVEGFWVRFRARMNVDGEHVYIDDVEANCTIDYEPNVTLEYPPQNYLNSTSDPVNVVFNCSAKDDFDVYNISLYITNAYNQSFSFNNSCNVATQNGSCNWTLSLHNGNYTWNCLAYDNRSQHDWGDSNRSLLIDDAYPNTPVVNSYECEINSAGNWQLCNNLAYGSTLRQVRVNCTVQGANVTNVTISLFNIPDSNYLLDNYTSDNSTGYWQLDIDDILIEDSGDFNISIICLSSRGIEKANSTFWSIPWGTLEGVLLNPTSSRDVIQNTTFNFSSRVSCIGGECGDVNATAGYKGEWWDTNWNKRRSFNLTSPDNTERINEIVRVNVSGFGGSLSSCDDELRIISGLTSEQFAEIPFTVESGDNSTWCYVRFLANVSSTTPTHYYAYYNNIAATNPGYSAVKISYVDNSNFSATTDWTYYETEPDDTGEYTTAQSYSPTQSYNIYTGTAATQGNYAEIFQDIVLPCHNCSLTVSAYNRLESAGTTENAFYAQIIMDTTTLSSVGTPPDGSSPIDWTMRSNTYTPSSSVERLHLRFLSDVTFASGWGQRDVFWDNVEIAPVNPINNVVTIGSEENLVVPISTTPSAAPFWTSSSNPYTPLTRPCLGNLKSGESCDTTWIVNATGAINSKWDLLVQYAPTTYASYISNNITSHVEITIVDYIRPEISNIQCKEIAQAWGDCSDVQFNDQLDAIRAQCIYDVGDPIQNMTFKLTNINDNYVYFDSVTADNSSGYWLLNISDITIRDSGDFNLYATCTANPTGVDDINWSIPFGFLTLGLLPFTNQNRNVTQNQFFTFRAELNCNGGECGDSNASLWYKNADTSLQVIEFIGFEDDAVEEAKWIDDAAPSGVLSVEAGADWNPRTGSYALAMTGNIDPALDYWYRNISLAGYEDVSIEMYSSTEDTESADDYIMYYWNGSEYSFMWEDLNRDSGSQTVWSQHITPIPYSEVTNDFRIRVGWSTSSAAETMILDDVNVSGYKLYYWNLLNTTSGDLPLYTIDSNPLYPLDTSCLHNMSGGDSCTLEWQVNATGSISSVWNMIVWSEPLNYSQNVSRINSSIINLTIVNNALPHVVDISLTPDYPEDFNDLVCFFTVEDPDVFDDLYVNVTWFRDNISFESNIINVTSGIEYSDIMESSNTSINDEWYCQVTPFDNVGAGNTTNSSVVTILSDAPPLIHYIQCQEDNMTWGDCSIIGFSDYLTQVRVNCTDTQKVTNATFSLINIPDNYEFFNATTSYQQGDYFILNISDILIQDSGEFNLHVVCRDNASNERYDFADWTVPWGTLVASLVSPSANVSVSKGVFFTWTSSVLCSGGECGSINATLDPEALKGNEPGINIINPQSYPMLGGNWTVLFNTKGKSDLTITVNEDTAWSNVEDKGDLKFMDLRCGQDIVDYEWIHTGDQQSVFVPGYECSDVSYETSRVLTSGRHNLVFDYGPNRVYAHNLVSYVHSDGSQGTSFTFNISSPDNRLVVIVADDESTGTYLTGVTVDGKSCDLVNTADNPVGAGNHMEMWYCDEDHLGSSSGDVTIAITGADPGWAIHAHLYTGVDQNGPYDNQTDSTSQSQNEILPGAIDIPLNGLLVFGAANGQSGSYNDADWDTNPTEGTDDGLSPEIEMTEVTDGPNPASAVLATAYWISTISDQTDRLFRARGSTANNRGTGIIASWKLAQLSKGVIPNTPGSTPFWTSTANPHGYSVSSCLENMTDGDICTTSWEVNATGGLNTVWEFFAYYNASTYTGYIETNYTPSIYITIVNNTLPNITALDLLPIFPPNYVNLNCTFTIYDPDFDNDLTVNVTWFRNNITFESNVYSVTSGQQYIDIMESSNTSTNEEWHCQVAPFDNLGPGTPMNSSHRIVLDNAPPQVTGVLCQLENTTWIDCTNIVFGQNLTAVRANCTDDFKVENVSFWFFNLEDNYVYFNNLSSYNYSKQFVFNNTDVHILDSGNFYLNVTCYDNSSLWDRQVINWSIPWGTLSASLVDPDSDTSVQRNAFFTFTSSITCLGGECGDVNAILDPLSYVRSSGTTGTSFSFDIGSPQDRLVVIVADDESTGTYLTGATVDGKSCDLVNTADNSIGTGNHMEMWYCDENHLGSSSGSVTVAIQGGNAGWAVHAHLYTDIDQHGPYDSQTDSTSQSQNEILPGVVDIPADGLLVFGAGNGMSGTYNDADWDTNPTEIADDGLSPEIEMTEVTDGPNPDSAVLATAYWISSTTEQTNRQFRARGSTANNRGTGIVASWYELYKGIVPMFAGSPFYTIDQNPMSYLNTSCLADMIAGDTCQVSWQVNATGQLGSTWEFFVDYNTTEYDAQVSDARTSSVYITITDASLVPPQVYLLNPDDATQTNNASIEFECHATDNIGLQNLSFYLTTTDTLQFNDSVPASGTETNVTFNKTLEEGWYKWNCWAFDTDGNDDWGATNRTLIIDLTKPWINLTYPTPNATFIVQDIIFTWVPIDNFGNPIICNLTINAIDYSVNYTDTGISVNNNTEGSSPIMGIFPNTYLWYVTCIDEAGNVNVSETRNFTISDLPPTVELITQDDYWTNQHNITLYYNATDNEGINHSDLYINGAYNKSNYTVEMEEPQWFDLFNLAEGRYNWTVNVTDVGNLTDQAPWQTFYIDYTDPIIILNYPNESISINSSSIDVNFTAIDNLDPTLVCNITINGTVNESGINADSNQSTIQTISGLRDGISFMNITCIDEAGNINTSMTVAINVSAPPTIELNYPDQNHSQKLNSIYLNYTPSDNSGLDHCDLLINGGYNDTEPAPNNNEMNYFYLEDMKEGAYTWAINCTDISGYHNISKTRTFFIDFTAPNITLIIPPPGDIVTSSIVVFNYTVADNLAEDMMCNLTLNGAVNISNIPSPNNTVVSRNITIFEETTHYWNVTCWDGAGNINVSVTWNFSVLVPPAVDLISPDDNYVTNISEINFTYYSFDSSGLQNSTLIINGQPNKSDPAPNNDAYNFFNLTGLADGRYNWTVQVFDDDNLSTTPDVKWFTIDTAPPTVQIIFPTSYYTVTTNNFSLQFNASDNLDDYLRCHIYFNEQLLSGNVSVQNGFVHSESMLKNDGYYNWSVICFDEINNSAYSGLINFSVEAPPNVSLDAPPNMTRTSNTSLTFYFTPHDDFGLQNCTLILDNELNGSVIDPASDVQQSISVDNLIGGMHNWTVRCIDAPPDLNEYAPPVKHFIIDLTGPAIDLIFPEEYGVYNYDDINFTWNATDMWGTALICNLTIDERVNVTNISATSGLLANQTVFNLSQGNHNWSITCWDDFNNTNSTGLVNFTINAPDLTLNNTHIGFNNTNPDINETLTINASIYNLGGATALNVPIDFWDGLPESGVYIGTDILASVSPGFSELAEIEWNITGGYHTIWVIVNYTGVELNTSNNNASVNISVLRSMINSPLNNSYSNALQPTFNFTLQDYTYDTINYSVLVDGAPNGQTGQVTDNVSQTVNVPLSAGQHYVQIRATDYLGRIKDSERVYIIVDRTDPSLNYIWPTPPDNWVQAVTNVTINVSIEEDNPDTLILYWAGFVNETRKDYGNLSNYTLYNLSEGVYTYYVWANDSATNFAQTSERTVRIDLKEPTINLESPDNEDTWTTSNVVEFYYNVSDASQYLNCSLLINGTVNDTSYNVEPYLSQNFVMYLRNGKYTWAINCSDQLGRVNISETRNLTVNAELTNWSRIWYERHTNDWTSTAFISLMPQPDAVENNINTSIGNQTLYTMANATSPYFGGNGVLIPMNTAVEFWGTFLSTGRWGYVTWKVVLSNSTGEYLIAQSGNDDDTYTGSNYIYPPANNRRTLNGTDFTAKTWILGPLDRIRLIVNIFNDDTSQPEEFIHYWDEYIGRSWSYVEFDQFITVGSLVVNLTEPSSDLVIPPNMTYNHTCLVNCSVGTCIDTYVYALYNSSGINWTNISSSGNLVLNGTQQNPLFLGNITEAQNVTFIIRGVLASENNIRCYAESLSSTAYSPQIRKVTVNDTIPPNVTLSSPENGYWLDYRNVTFYFDASDNVGLGNCSIFIDGLWNATKSGSELINNGLNNFTVDNIPEGYHNWTVECNDTNTNKGTTDTWNFTIDLTKPTINLIYPGDTANITSQPFDLNFTVIDNLDTNLTCNLTIDGVLYRSNFSAINNTVARTSVTLTEEDTHYWNVTCWDGESLSNINNVNYSKTRSFNLFIPPNITLVSPDDNNWTGNENVTFFFNVSDSTGIHNCTIIINEQKNTSKDSSQIINGGTNNLTVNRLNGTVIWSIECYDNTSQLMYNRSSNRTLNVDVDGPLPIITTANQSWFNTTTPSINFYIIDNMDLDSINYSFFVDAVKNTNGTIGNNTPTSDNLTILADGPHIVLIEAYDNVGNYRNSSPITIYVDTIKPSIRLNEPTNGGTTVTNIVTFNYTPIDALSWNLTCNLTLDNTIRNTSVILNDTNFTVTIGGLTAGIHWWNVTCMDLAGNINTSETWNFTIPLPDFTLNSTHIVFNTSAPQENKNLTINATVFNIGQSDAENVVIQFYEGHYSLGNQINGNFTRNISKGANATVSVNWTPTTTGSFDIYVIVDPPLATNGSIAEENESNNYAHNQLGVSSNHVLYGNLSGVLYIQDLTNQTLYEWDPTNFSGSNIYAADYDAQIDWQKLHPLGRSTANVSEFDDFHQLDTQLFMENNSDDINATWTFNNSPRQTDSFTVFKKSISLVPIVNSTNNTNFITGIMWDTSDPNLGGRFNGSQDVVFVTRINENTTGSLGLYDFEMKIPANVRLHKTPDQITVKLYVEIK
ncbi:hypothetical protein JW930_02320 [Candidatus Woesearchaeota archaeon]|nr:hypothetical protein [Candidatus Woesearchaeota archaeon]